MSTDINSMLALMMKKAYAQIQTQNAKISRNTHALESTAIQFLTEIFDLYVNLVHTQRMKILNKIRQEKTAIEGKIRHSEVLYALKRFGVHVEYESKGKVKIVPLVHDSSQFARCEKAVRDNLSESSALCVDELQIIGVFKIENVKLAAQFQASTLKTSGKIKGLFCSVSRSSLSAFTVRGLARHPLASDDSDRQNDSSTDVFEDSWFSFAPPSEVPPLCKEGVRDAGYAVRMAGTEATQDAALRFSRQSVKNDINTIRDTSLVLCRVLLSSVLTVAGQISNFDIKIAIQKGCDAVYSSLSDEYVLLRSDFVLPEFAMCLDYSETIQAAPTQESSLAKAIITKCEDMERLLSASVGFNSKIPVSDKVEGLGLRGDQDFDAAQSKQALIAAVGNIVDEFSRVKITALLDLIERT